MPSFPDMYARAHGHGVWYSWFLPVSCYPSYSCRGRFSAELFWFSLLVRFVWNCFAGVLRAGLLRCAFIRYDSSSPIYISMVQLHTLLCQRITPRMACCYPPRGARAGTTHPLFSLISRRMYIPPPYSRRAILPAVFSRMCLNNSGNVTPN